MATDNAVSIYEAMGQAVPEEPSFLEKAKRFVGVSSPEPIVHTGAISIFAAQGMEEPEPTTLENIGGFLTDPESWRQVGKKTAGMAAQASDFVTSFITQGFNIPGQVGTQLYALATGEDQKLSAQAAQEYQLFPESVRAPWASVAKSLGKEAEKVYEENPVGWILGKISEGVAAVGDKAEETGLVSSEEVQLAASQVMGLLGLKAAKQGLGRTFQQRGVVKTQLPPVTKTFEEAPVAESAAAPKTLYEQIAPEARGEDAIVSAKQRLKDIKAAVKAETPAEKAVRLETVELPETEHVWSSGGTDVPVFVTGKPVRGADGKMYTPVKQQGTATYVPTAELKPVPKAEPQVGLPEPVEAKSRITQVGAADPKLLAAIAAAGGAAAYLAANPEDTGKLTALGLLGTLGVKGKSLKGVLEADLIQRVRTGDAAAFAELYQRSSPTVRRSLASYEKSGVDVEDVMQRTYEKVYKALEKDPEAPGGFRGDSALETFAYRTAHNLAKNAVRDAKARPQTMSMETELGEGKTLADTLGHEETPLRTMETKALQDRLSEAMDKVDPSFRRAFEMRELEGMSYEDIAQVLEVPVGTVRSRIFRAKEQLQKSLRDYGGKQSGKVDPALATAVAAVGGGAAFGALFSPGHPLRDAFYGALAGGVLGTPAGRGALKAIIKSPDVALGLISTRLQNIHPSLRFNLVRHELRVLQNLERANDTVLPFIQALAKLPKEVKGKIDRALLNGDVMSVRSIPELAKTYPAVQQLLGSLEGQLQNLGRFAEGVGNYFPRVVKDLEGLKSAIGQELKTGLEATLLEAEAKMMKKSGRELTDIERSVIANRYLFSADTASFLPGYAKARRLKEVPEHLQQYYEAPTESLLRYISGAVNDVEIAKFFGKDLAAKTQGKRVFTDVDNSIGNMTSRLMAEGKLTQPQAMELRSILKARFEGGEKGMHTALANARNITNTALLGNIMSTATQIGDSLLTVYHHGLVNTLQALAIQLVGKDKITPKQLGLINHVAEELSGQGVTGHVLQASMKYSGFKAIDMFAKGLNLNAALLKNRKLIQTPEGQAKFIQKYGEAFGQDIARIMDDLNNRRLTPEIEELAFFELSDAQPVSKAEMSQAYLAHPNGRILYQLKTYMQKQMDVVRRDAYQKIATGKPAQILEGSKNLAALATIYAVSNIPGDVIKDWLAGRDVDPFTTPKLVENVMQTFGLNRYATQRVAEGQVAETAIGVATPPLKVLQDIIKMDEKSVRYIPIGGRVIYDRYLGGNERREIYETRSENKGLLKGTGKKLSPKAKAYLLRKRAERLAEKQAR